VLHHTFCPSEVDKITVGMSSIKRLNKPFTVLFF
jgi:hypothetical protein